MITINALEKRINRKLKQGGQALRKPRSERARIDLGDYYIVDDRNHINAQHIDLMYLAKGLGVLRPGEKVYGYMDDAAPEQHVDWEAVEKGSKNWIKP